MLLVARSWIAVLVATVIIASLAALIVSLRTPPTYQASATVLVGPPLSSASITFTDLTIAQDLAQTYAQVATSRPVLDATAAAVDIPADQNDLASTVTARTPPQSSFVIITAQAHEAAQAAAIANAVAAELIKQGPSADDQARIQTEYQSSLAANAAEIAAVQAQLDDLRALASPSDAEVQQMAGLQNQLASLQATRASLLNSTPSAGANVLTVIESAVPPTRAIGPSLLANVGFGAAIGLVIALVVAFVVENMRQAGLLRRPGPGTAMASPSAAPVDGTRVPGSNLEPPGRPEGYRA